MAEPFWVLGVSIDEEITWALAQVDPDNVSLKQAYKSEKIPVGLIADLKDLDHERPIDLHKKLSNYFSKLQRDHEKFGQIGPQIRSIGISTIGVTDRKKGRLIDIRRKAFAKQPGRSYRADFTSIFSEQFPQVGGNIFVLNDVVAKSLACHVSNPELSPTSVCCYINLSEGINIGVANGHGPVLTSDTNSEFGHIYPPLHAMDADKDHVNRRFSACPVHLTCFEGLASAKRIRDQWQGEIRNRPIGRFVAEAPDALDMLSHYAAHLCWNAAITVSPDKIFLGGPLCSKELLDETKKQFLALNNGYFHSDALDKNLDRFILLAGPPPIKHSQAGDLSGLMGALELARIGPRAAHSLSVGS